MSSQKELEFSFVRYIQGIQRQAWVNINTNFMPGDSKQEMYTLTQPMLMERKLKISIFQIRYLIDLAQIPTEISFLSSSCICEYVSW